MRWNPIGDDEDEEAEEDHALENRGSSSRSFKRMHPTPRQGHSLIGIDRRCILFGGYGIRRTVIGNEVAVFGSSPAVSEGSALPAVSRGSTSSLSSLHRTPSSFSVASTSAEGSEKDIISEFETESEGTCFNDSYIFDVGMSNFPVSHYQRKKKTKTKSILQRSRTSYVVSLPCFLFLFFFFR